MPVRRRVTRSARNSCTFCLTPVHHMSVLHFLVHEMQEEALWGNWAFSENATTGRIVGELERIRKS